MAKVGPHQLVERLNSTCIFKRGLPSNTDLQDSATAHIFSAVLRRGFVKDVKDTNDPNDEAIKQCYRNGWLHADLVLEGITGYFFSSSLHRWHVEWKLWGSVDQIQAKFVANNLLELVINVIRLFSPSHFSERSLGPGCIQRPSEAQYQDELYRCCNAFSEGSLLTLPEFGTRKGRVDFYVPAKCWGIELLRDGDRLASHWGRFSDGGSYTKLLPLTDYIIVDCRTTRPRQEHPRKWTRSLVVALLILY
jgi:hypothetical protein